MAADWGAADEQSLLAAVATALAGAPPYELPERLQSAVRGVDPTATCVLHLLDHRAARLVPVGDVLARAHGVDGTDHGRCLVAQEVVSSTASPLAVLVPVTVRGDRLGVLEVHDCRVPSRTLLRVAEVLAMALASVGTVTDRYVVAKRWESLTLAAEMQWDKLPGRSLSVPYADVAGHLEPAYRVVGDTYDWTVDGTGLQAVVVDGSGYGTHAAGSTAFTVAALRNARREGADLAGQARLADQAVHARFHGELSASAVLLDVDVASGVLRYCLAGSGGLVLVREDGAELVEGGEHPPLGADEDHPYTAVAVPAGPVRRVVLVSDGALDAGDSEQRSRRWLLDCLADLAETPAPETVRVAVERLRQVHAGQPLSDDAVVVCLDLRAGPGALTGT
ncbi:PP2C family protein-serine/threonine phosphatase [Aquipuribacter nitratireducens]|uniref:PP2C family protein-serine/threonine phosphatase n=1 Tax=Aquipuribacter nitratireducens TaxID=650104 RepID=A0ABW0GP49_9MICO